MPVWEYVEAIVLGVVQGITEFLPVSSSGHLVILGEIIHQVTGQEIDPEGDLQMNVALHLGTLFSILVVFRSDLVQLRNQLRICIAIVIATIPVVILGYLCKDWIETYLMTPMVAGWSLLVTAAMLVMGQKFERNEISFEGLSMPKSLLIGLFQGVALLPGVSRSGSTISAGLLCGLRRDTAATFSFYIAIPVILGAVVLTGADIFKSNEPVSSLGNLALGIVVSFLVGWAALRWLLRLVSQRRLHWFAWYCTIVGICTIVWQLIA